MASRGVVLAGLIAVLGASVLAAALHAPGGVLRPGGDRPAGAPPVPLPADQPEADRPEDNRPEDNRPALAAPADPSLITVDDASLFAWALLDLGTGAIAGSENSATDTNTVESMIKPWIAADHLRRLNKAGRRPSARTLTELTLVIVDSNDPLAEKYYVLGGRDAVVRRLASICDLDRVKIVESRWSRTELTARDAVRYARCLADGRAAGPEWTEWVLDAMRAVRGDVDDQVSGEVQGGRWGILDGVPPDQATDTAIKNGWTEYVNGWRVNCLAVHPDWALAVLLRMRSLRAAAEACESVAEQLVVDAARSGIVGRPPGGRHDNWQHQTVSTNSSSRARTDCCRPLSS